MTKLLTTIPYDSAQASVIVDEERIWGYGPDLKYTETRTQLKIHLMYASKFVNQFMEESEGIVHDILVTDNFLGDRYFKAVLDTWEYTASSEIPVVSFVFNKVSKPVSRKAR